MSLDDLREHLESVRERFGFVGSLECFTLHDRYMGIDPELDYFKC